MHLWNACLQGIAWVEEKHLADALGCCILYCFSAAHFHSLIFVSITMRKRQSSLSPRRSRRTSHANVLSETPKFDCLNSLGVCLVTGGNGYFGNRLVGELVRYSPSFFLFCYSLVLSNIIGVLYRVCIFLIFALLKVKLLL